MKLNLNIDEELQILEKYQMTPTELFVTRLILISQDENDLEMLKRYFSIPEKQRGSFRNILISLQEKEIILKSYKVPNAGEPFVVEDVVFNKNVIKNIYRTAGDMGIELFEHYPQFATINGNLMGIRNVSRKFDDLEDAWRKYGKIIKWNPATHREIIELLDWAHDNNVSPNKSLGNFICDHSWLDLKALKETNVNYENVRIL